MRSDVKLVMPKFLLILLGAFLLFLLTPTLPHLDFSAYWKSASMLLGGENPYNMPPDRTYLIDVPEYLRPGIEHFYARVWGPPMVLGILLPFGLLSLSAAKAVFTFFTYFSAISCSSALFSIFGGVKSLTRVRLLLFGLLLPWGLFFYCLSWGAPTWIFVDGLVLGVWFALRGRNFLCGLALSLCCLKPHLFAYLAIALLIRAVIERDFRVVLGGIIGVLLFSVLPLLVQPEIYGMYLAFITERVPHQYTGASLGSVLHSAIDPPRWFLLYLPMMIALLYELLMFKKKSYPRLWYHLIRAAPISVFLAPYCWGHDYLVALPFLFLVVSLFEERFKAKDIESVIRLSAVILWCSLTEKYFAFQPFFSHKFYLFSYGLGLMALVLEVRRMRLDPGTVLTEKP